MEQTLTSLSVINKSLESLCGRHQTHSSKLQVVQSALSAVSTDASSLLSVSPLAPLDQTAISQSLARLKGLEFAIEQQISHGDSTFERDFDRILIEKTAVEAQSEARFKSIATEYLSALKSLR